MEVIVVTLEMHIEAVETGERALVVDDPTYSLTYYFNPLDVI